MYVVNSGLNYDKINFFHTPLYIEVLGQSGVSRNRIFWKVVLRTGDGYRGQL